MGTETAKRSEDTSSVSDNNYLNGSYSSSSCGDNYENSQLVSDMVAGSGIGATNSAIASGKRGNSILACRHEREDSASSSSSAESVRGRLSATNIYKKNAFLAKNGGKNGARGNKEKKVEDKDKDNKDNGGGNSNEQSDNGSQPSMLLLSSAKQRLESNSSGGRGVIDRLIDKELIRTAIMEQDEDCLPRGIQQGYFKNLTHLDISGNSAEKLDLRSLSRLEWLCCANNNLEVLTLSGCSLTYLDCSSNNLHSISVDPVPNNLTTLQISYNIMDDLPTWTWMVPELFIIYASHNRIRQLDCKFQNCLNNLPVRELYLQCNKIEFVSKDFVQRATKLKILNLSQNLIEYMPNFGKKCPIQELSLSRNRLQDTDDKDALDFLLECSHLKRLFLGFNKIENLSERCLSAWKSMEELILCGNRIRHIPSKISSLSNLRVFRVHSNKLEAVPSLNKMPTLKMVDLSHNNLRKINIENLISGGNLTYLDISCNEKLTVNPEKLHCQKRPMNLVEVSNPRKKVPGINTKIDQKEFPANPPWEIGFSELPDRNLTLSVTQYRDINLAFGKEALFGIFDGGDGNAAPKYIPKCIAKIYAEEKNIEENSNVSLKYTLLNAMKNVRQLGNNKPIQGLLCLLSMHEDHLTGPTFQLDLAMIGGIRCLLVEAGRKVTRLTDMAEEDGSSPLNPRSNSASPTGASEDTPPSSLDSQSDTSSTRSGYSPSSISSAKNNLNGNIPDPKLFSVPLTTKAEYLVIANQSLWNHMNEEEIISEIEFNKNKKSVLVAKKLTDLTQSHSCKQCLSVIIVRFKWHFTPGNNRPGNGMGVAVGQKVATQQISSDTGPLSYCSGSSEYSDMSNPLVSVTTPDSAIDSDRSSRTSSSSAVSDSVNGSTTGGKHKPSKNPSKLNGHSNGNGKSYNNRRSSTTGNGGSTTALKNDRNTHQRKNSLDDEDDDAVSLANTSISQMSVEQLKCWEYMLEQNTKLLFKKELDSLSKGVFTRNQKLRKSVLFPYQQQPPDQNLMAQSTGKKNKSVQNLLQYPGTQVNKTSSPGFYTLSKAKSLSHLFSAGGDPAQVQKIPAPADPSNQQHPNQLPGYPPPPGIAVAPPPHPFIFPNNVHAFSNGFASKFPAVLNTSANAANSNSSGGSSSSNSNNLPVFFGSVRANGKKTGLIGGPNAAYFGTIQRIVPPPALTHQYPTYYGPAEIQEIKNLDSMQEHDSRLKKYWENKITEL